MDSMKLIGLNTKWYRYQKNYTQEKFSEKINFKMAYLSTIENGSANLTLKNVDLLAKNLGVAPKLLFEEETAKLATKLPKRVDMYNKEK